MKCRYVAVLFIADLMIYIEILLCIPNAAPGKEAQGLGFGIFFPCFFSFFAECTCSSVRKMKSKQ